MKTHAHKCMGAIGFISSAGKKKTTDIGSHTKVVCECILISTGYLPLEGTVTVERAGPHGLQREVRSLLTLISHALGQNEMHSSFLHVLIHSQMKNCVQGVIQHHIKRCVWTQVWLLAHLCCKAPYAGLWVNTHRNKNGKHTVTYIFNYLKKKVCVFETKTKIPHAFTKLNP